MFTIYLHINKHHLHLRAWIQTTRLDTKIHTATIFFRIDTTSNYLNISYTRVSKYIVGSPLIMIIVDPTIYVRACTLVNFSTLCPKTLLREHQLQSFRSTPELSFSGSNYLSARNSLFVLYYVNREIHGILYLTKYLLLNKYLNHIIIGHLRHQIMQRRLVVVVFWITLV